MSITTWTRIEPDTQTGDAPLDLADGVAARLADPLWLLGRQWQMGESSGEDAGSPVSVRIDATSFALDSLRIGDAVQPYAHGTTAVEAAVEHDGRPADRRTRASGGASLADRLAEAGLEVAAARLPQDYPLADGDLPLPAIDGDRLLADLDAGSLATRLGVGADAQARPAFDAACTAWATWYRPRAARGTAPAWVPDRLEYRFAMGATIDEGALVLDAPEHTGGRLDWDAFSARPVEPGGTAAPARTQVDTTPAVLQIPGMPSLAFWEFEDPHDDPGRIESGPADPARLLLVEAALAYATDWFLLPLRLPGASLSRIDALAVTDTFGVTTLIRPVDQVHPHPAWRLWRVGDLPYLLLPPTDIESQEAAPIARIAFVRDEAANLAWVLAIEPRPEVAAPPPTPAEPADADAPSHVDLYIPISGPPDNRTPLALVEIDHERWLLRGTLAGSAAAPPNDLLADDFRLHDEELPDDGLTLDRRFELGRTSDGALHLWISRVKRPGARAPASGLSYDKIG